MKRLAHWLAIVVFVLTSAQRAFATPDAAAVFDRIWQRYDRPVAEGRTDRSWTWGPALTGPIDQPFAAVPEGQRKVQYFDKGRMEINNRDGDPNDQWYVTSGRLPVELMTGNRDNGRTDGYTSFIPSYVSALGDPDSFPAYPDLLPLYESPGTLEEGELGKPITHLLRPNLTIGEFADYAGDPATILVRGANNHGMPQAFVDFQRQRGVVYVKDHFVKDQVYDPTYIFGLPVTPPVWTRTRIGGVERPVLFQVFERRVLTYNPANPAAFRVEMGNVGQHYKTWLDAQYGVSEYEPIDWQRREVRARNNQQIVYTLEVDIVDVPTGAPPGSGTEFYKRADYRFYASGDGGATRELRRTGTTGIACRLFAGASLLMPRSPDADPGRIGIALGCIDHPSSAQTGGLSTFSSVDGGRSFTEH